eukprot:6248713-Prymnesium_polylepis.1
MQRVGTARVPAAARCVGSRRTARAPLPAGAVGSKWGVAAPRLASGRHRQLPSGDPALGRDGGPGRALGSGEGEGGEERRR